MKTDGSTAYPPDFTERSTRQSMNSKEFAVGAQEAKESEFAGMRISSPPEEKQVSPPPQGYVSWEALLASDGKNEVIRNPRQEISSLFATIIPENCRLLERIAEERYAELFCKYQEELGDYAISQDVAVNYFMQETRYLFEDIITVPFATKDAILRFIRLQLSRVQHDRPNRWVNSFYWSWTRDPHQWKMDWQLRYLPEAIAALHVAERNVADPLLAEASQRLRSQLERWREKARALFSETEKEPSSADTDSSIISWGLALGT